MLKALQAAGCQGVRVRHETLQTTFPSAQRLLRHLHALGVTGGDLSSSGTPLTRGELERLFGRVEQARIHECGLCMPWRNHMPIWIVREPKVDIPALWPDWKDYE